MDATRLQRSRFALLIVLLLFFLLGVTPLPNDVDAPFPVGDQDNVEDTSLASDDSEAEISATINNLLGLMEGGIRPPEEEIIEDELEEESVAEPVAVSSYFEVQYRERPLAPYRNEASDGVMRFLLEKKRDVVERGYKRSGRYLPMIRKIFAQIGVPAELAYLSAVESNYNTYARSSVNAMGLWQLMTPTARKFGLRIELPWYDERLDPERATWAAGRLLAYLYDRYESWELALAAYNAGEGWVNRTMKQAVRAGEKPDYWNLRLPKQTRGFVPAFLAMVAIYENPEKHGLSKLEKDPPWHGDLLEVEISTTIEQIAERVQVPREQLETLNPAWKRGLIPPLRQSRVLFRMPENKGKLFLAAVEAKPMDPIPWLMHTVGEGQTVSQIALGYGVPTIDVLSLNGLNRRSLLNIGQTLFIPLMDGDPQAMMEMQRAMEVFQPNFSEQPAMTQITFHKVKAGESLWSISRGYRVRMDKLRVWNRLGEKLIKPGQELVVFASQPRPALALTD